MKEIELKLSIDDVNLVLEALGQLLFVRVVELVSSIQTQAQTQIGKQSGNAIGTIPMKEG